MRFMDIVRLRWDGAPSIKAARSALRQGGRVEIELPLETHHALYRHLHPDAPRGPDEDIDASDSLELLGRVATVAGLEELAQLRPAVRRARYRVRLTSPDPCLCLIPPQKAR